MSFQKIVHQLYSDKLDDILQVVNDSVYIDDHVPDPENLKAIHTGFVFTSHKGNDFELLYDYQKDTVVRQVRNIMTMVPQILGLVCEYNGKYYYSFSNMVYTGISKSGKSVLWEFITEFIRHDDGSVEVAYRKSENDTPVILKSFLIFYDEGEQDSNLANCIDLPLNKILETKLYFDSHKWKVNISDEEYYQINSDEEDDYEEEYFDNSDNYGKSFSKYSGTYAQDVMELSDDFIDDVLGGDPDAYWNID